MSIQDIIDNKLVNWMKADGPENQIVISSRIRLARNINMLPFPHLLENNEEAEKIMQAIQKAVTNNPELELTRLSQISSLEKQNLLEKHLISPQHAESNDAFRGVITDKNGSITIMINEEDHLRIQCLVPGLQLNQAYKWADDMDDFLEKDLEYAFDERRGYLTACPTNVGTGMRASVMLHLPAIAAADQQNHIFGSMAQFGLTVRGLYGEGTEALGNLYQMSNQVTLGLNEEDIINNLWTVTLHIIEQERNIRDSLLRQMKYQMEDRVWRAYGLLTNARVITSNEALSLLSDVRLGCDMGILPAIPAITLNELIVAIRPAHLQRAAGRQMDTMERDLLRADIIKASLLGRKKEEE